VAHFVQIGNEPIEQRLPRSSFRFSVRKSLQRIRRGKGPTKLISPASPLSQVTPLPGRKSRLVIEQRPYLKRALDVAKKGKDVTQTCECTAESAQNGHPRICDRDFPINRQVRTVGMRVALQSGVNETARLGRRRMGERDPAFTGAVAAVYEHGAANAKFWKQSL
jgi:hypothetical protein